MKVVILAGGYGTRLSEHTTVVPKPLVEIGGRPILWHIMKLYSHHGLNDFVICCGYKGSAIKDYFLNYSAYQTDWTIDLQRNQIESHRSASEPWRVTLVDTGEKTMTGGRLKRVREHLGNSTFCLTYGDGVSAAAWPFRHDRPFVRSSASCTVPRKGSGRRSLDQRRLLRP
jgi:glucose-1-phosphate cytidylyltransferase